MDARRGFRPRPADLSRDAQFEPPAPRKAEVNACGVLVAKPLKPGGALCNPRAFSAGEPDRIASPEQLSDYIRVSTPSVWLGLGALIAIVVSLALWGFTGTLPVTLTLNGLVEGDEVTCFIPVDSLQNDIMGCRALITLPDGSTVGGAVSFVADMPSSADELAAALEKDWLISRLVAGDYAYPVTIRAESALPAGALVRLALVTSEVKPIYYILS